MTKSFFLTTKKANKYTSADIQNELLQVMALSILRKIAANIQNRPFSVMVDETTDVNTQEQCYRSSLGGQ